MGHAHVLAVATSTAVPKPAPATSIPAKSIAVLPSILHTPAFAEFTRKTGLAAYWDESGLPDFCRGGNIRQEFCRGQ
ncbi:MAG: hypothetical protein WBW61_07310 [Rhodanobacteraceae bacterium]